MQGSEAAGTDLVHERLPAFLYDGGNRRLMSGETRNGDERFEEGQNVRHKIMEALSMQLASERILFLF